MKRISITDEQITAGAAVLAGYKDLHLNWRNAAIDVFQAMMEVAPEADADPTATDPDQRARDYYAGIQQGIVEERAAQLQIAVERVFAPPSTTRKEER